ncbi:Hypothetical protein, predicted lipoprotein [Metamycoplasma auris 15026]|uniref:SGNH hydrolase-type esterase domain-containing protein n=1 Tax=Metamycoplasma auris 15026 TaxID=1188233 RepID=N9V1S1_9BACT|nr:SGNH/GDSL hydrolase family protein [Metamycoplasma auris]ENY69327.1 Hypothetical protein, predicted lipoprotein [Metamycoplasma auris 15026]
MKATKMIKKVSKILLSTSLILSLPLVSASCKKENKDEKKDDAKIKNNIQRPLKGNISYLAIGDDYAIGHNNTNNSKINNYFDPKTNQVSGISYASYLANAIAMLKDKDTNLKDYKNYGLVASNLDDWLLLLDTKENKQSSHLEKTKKINEKLGTFNSKLEKKNLIQSLKDANLLTISLGFNDIFKKEELLNLIFNQIENSDTLLKNLEAEITKRLNEIAANYPKLIEAIKQINPNININLTGYLTPFLHLQKIEQNKEISKFLNETTNKLNAIIKKIASEKEINFYSFENPNLIISNISDFGSDFLSFYPNKNAYKKLGQDIFAKMAIDKDKYNLLFSNKEKSDHKIALLFNKIPETIKAVVFGINDSSNGAYNVPYTFENLEQNKEIIDSEKKSNSVEFLLDEFAINLDSLNENSLKKLLMGLFSSIGISNKDFYSLINDLLKNNKDLVSLKNLIKQILESSTFMLLLKTSNTKILSLIEKQSHHNTTLEQIRNQTALVLEDKTIIFNLLKDIFNDKFLENKQMFDFLKTNLPKIIESLFGNALTNKLFIGPLKEIFFNKIDKNLINKELAKIINEISLNLLDKSKRAKYFKENDFSSFVKALLKDIEESQINLYAFVLDSIRKNENLFNKVVDEITASLDGLYKIKHQEKVADVKYFIKSLLSAVDLNKLKDKNEWSYGIFKLLIESIVLNNENPKQEITKKFLINLALNNKQGINQGNKLFFKLISFLPDKLTSFNKDKYVSGMVHLTASLIDIERFLEPDKISDFINNKDPLLDFIKNISDKKNNADLTQEGKENIKKFISVVIDDGLNNNLAKLILEKFTNFAIIMPLSNLIKANGLEKELLELNSNYKSIEDLVKSWYKGLYESALSKEVVDKIKETINNIVFDENQKYRKENPIKFLLSVLENAEENGIFKIVEEVSNQLGKKQENYKFFVDFITLYLKKNFKIEIDEKDKKTILPAINKFFGKFPKSKIFTTLKSNFINLVKEINKKEIKDLGQLGVAFKNDLSRLTSSLFEKNNIEELLGLIVGENKEAKDSAIVKLLQLVLSKVNDQNKDTVKKEVGKLIGKLIDSPNFKNFISSQIDNISNLILKEDSNVKELAKQTKQKLQKLLLSDEIKFKELITQLINSLFDNKNGTENLKDLDSIGKWISKLLKTNKNLFDEKLKTILSELIGDQKYLKELIKFALEVVGKKFNFTSINDQVNDIAEFLSRSISNLNKSDGLSDLIIKIFGSLLNNGIFDKGFDSNKIKDSVLSTLKMFDYKETLNEEFFKKAAEAVFDKSISKEQFTKELTSLYYYLSTNIPKLIAALKPSNGNSSSPSGNPGRGDSSNGEGEEMKKLFDSLEQLIINSLKGLNGALADGGYKDIREATVETISKIIKEELSKAIKNIKSDLLSSNKLVPIIEAFLDNQYFKDLIKNVIDDFLSKKEIKENKSSEILNKVLERVSNKINGDIPNLIKNLSSDDKLMENIASSLIDFLGLKDTNEQDKKFLSELLKKILENLANNNYLKTKIVKRTTQHLTDYSKKFEIKEPFKWIIDAIDKIKSGFSLSDLNILGELVGEDKPINGENLVKLVNLLFGKSDFTNSLLYKTLRNINMNPDVSKRTNMKTLNDAVGNAISGIFSFNRGSNSSDSNDPHNMTPSLDALKFADDIFKIIYGEYSKKTKDKKDFKEKSQTNEWKAVYRLKVAIDFLVFEMFGRETETKDRDNWSKVNLYSGTRALLWELQEGTNLKWIPGVGNKFYGMAGYFKDLNERRQFTNYLKDETSGFLGFGKKYVYFTEDDYGPESITYIITSSGYNEKEKEQHLKDFKFKYSVDEKEKSKRISKKEYILLTLKEGGYGKFMKLNSKKSESKWSGLNTLNVDDFYPKEIN